MSMSKKDFVELADVLRPYVIFPEDGSEPILADDLCLPLIRELRSFMKRQNSAFMDDRWMSYLRGTCGPNGGSK